MKKIKGWLVLAVFLALVAGGVWGLMHLGQTDDKHSQAMIDRLFRPYFLSVSKGAYERAWTEYTTEAYQKKHPLAKFEAHYRAVFEEYDPVTEIEMVFINQTKELSTGRAFLRVQVKIHFGGRFVLVRFEVVEKGEGVYLIDSSALSSQMVKYYGPW